MQAQCSASEREASRGTCFMDRLLLQVSIGNLRFVSRMEPIAPAPARLKALSSLHGAPLLVPVNNVVPKASGGSTQIALSANFKTYYRTS